MLTITNDFDIIDYYHFPHMNFEDILYFDIETTGFSADTSSLYLIGCCYRKNHQFHLIQWFADTYDCESDLLHVFFQFIESFSVLVHFNGDTFDIPYLEKKCAQYSLPYNFSSIQSFDLYKKLSPYRKKLSLENLKLKTIENFLSIERKDVMDGKKLIKLYGTYMQERFKNKNPESIEELQHILLLHNQEDVQNLPLVCTILSYIDLFEKLPAILSADFYDKDTNSKLSLTDFISENTTHGYYRVSFSVPEQFSDLLKESPEFLYPLPNSNETVSLTFLKETAVLIIPVIKDQLNYYYPNYKDYFYLPKEDKAIHKSVGIYVEKEYRKKATADTAYFKQDGFFLPQLEPIFSPFFQYDRKDPFTFFQLTETIDFQSKQFQLFLLQWWMKMCLL